MNSIILGLAQYYQPSICSHAYHAIDRRVNNAALAVWIKLFSKQYNQMQVPLKTLCNLPHRHEGYDSKTFAIHIEEKWFGITYAFITHSRYESKPFDQKMTPYTVEGRRRYVNYRNKHKPLPCDRPSINTPEDIALACYADGKGWKANFEYFMNREYAYNRDKGKCKCCGKPFSITVPNTVTTLTTSFQSKESIKFPIWHGFANRATAWFITAQYRLSWTQRRCAKL